MGADQGAEAKTQELPLKQLPASELLALPARDLLGRFGNGGHKPGSGSAAALNGLLACKLAATVAQLTLARSDGGYREVGPEMAVLQSRLVEKHEVDLVDLFVRDCECFDRVIELRRERDATTDDSDRRRKGDAALAELRIATDIPIEIAQTCISVARAALTIFDAGFKSARGDSGVAASSALSGGKGALLVAYLNLKEFRGSDWAVERRANCDRLLETVQQLEVELLQRVVTLQAEGEVPAQITMEFGE